MKVLVVVPPVKDFYFTPQRASALGVEAVKTILENYPVECISINFSRLKKKSAKIQLPFELEYIKAFQITNEHGPISFFCNYFRFGPEIKTCAEISINQKPDIVFISCFAWAYAEEAISLASAIKEIKPNLKIAVGGAGVTVNPEYFIKHESIDFILTGEAENSLPAFLKKEYGMSKTKELSQIDFYRSLTGESKQKNIRYFSTILTRGCLKSCRFCANYLVHGRKFNKVDLSKIEAGIKKLPHDMNIHLNFEDDNILFDKEYFFEVLSLIKKEFPKSEFSAENGLDYTLMDSKTTEKLIEFGFKSFNLSMASTDDSILKQEGRRAFTPRLDEIVDAAVRQGVLTTCYFICGLEGDTKETVINNLFKLHNLPVLTGISMFYPVPGLPNFMPQKLSSYKPFLCAGSSAFPWSGSLSTKELITSFRLSRLSNMIKTIEGRIPTNEESTLPAIKLLKKIKQTGRLHSYSGKNIVEVPNQDDKLVDSFFSMIGLL